MYACVRASVDLCSICMGRWRDACTYVCVFVLSFMRCSEARTYGSLHPASLHMQAEHQQRSASSEAVFEEEGVWSLVLIHKRQVCLETAVVSNLMDSRPLELLSLK